MTRELPYTSTTALQLSEPDWQQTLATTCLDAIQTNGRAILCLAGRPGSGKSTMGKRIRKKGLPGIAPSRIAVVDDGVLSVPLLFFFNRRVRDHTKMRDELAPFDPYLLGKKLVVYVSSFPEHRLSACDIVVTVRCGEEERRRRLLARNTDGEIRFQRSANQEDFPRIPAKHFFEFVSR